MVLEDSLCRTASEEGNLEGNSNSYRFEMNAAADARKDKTDIQRRYLEMSDVLQTERCRPSTSEPARCKPETNTENKKK